MVTASADYETTRQGSRMIKDDIDNDVHVMMNNFLDFENSNLRSSVECASEQANGLLLAASRYGIFR